MKSGSRRNRTPPPWRYWKPTDTPCLNEERLPKEPHRKIPPAHSAILPASMKSGSRRNRTAVLVDDLAVLVDASMKSGSRRNRTENQCLVTGRGHVGLNEERLPKEPHLRAKNTMPGLRFCPLGARARHFGEHLCGFRTSYAAEETI